MTAIPRSRYRGLHDEVRPLARAIKEYAMHDLEMRIRERARFYTDDQVKAAFEAALHHMAEAQKWLTWIDREMRLNEGVTDELRGLADLIGDVRGVMQGRGT